MRNFTTALLVVALAASAFAASGDSKMEARLSQKKFEEAQRLDEYANSLRRRDWLKDRLVLELGFGSKYHVMGETGTAFGFGAEYITRWHLAPVLTYGFVPKTKDDAFEDISLEGFSGYKAGLAYYFFPKTALHLGLSVTYGDVYFDHLQKQDTVTNTRGVLIIKGWQSDLTITYLTEQWYYLTFNAGVYTTKIGSTKLPGARNNSMEVVRDGNVLKEVSVVVDPDGVPDYGIVFGAGIGFALPDLFPDDTEKRRRQREKTSVDR